MGQHCEKGKVHCCRAVAPIPGPHHRPRDRIHSGNRFVHSPEARPGCEARDARREEEASGGGSQCGGEGGL